MSYGRKEGKMLIHCLKPKSTILLTAVLLTLAACNSKSMLQYYVETPEYDLTINYNFNISEEGIYDEIKKIEKESNHPEEISYDSNCTQNNSYAETMVIEFITHPSGTMVDVRIPNNAVEVILRHFEAIENGDLAMYRSTVGWSDGADLYHHISLMIRYFGDIVDINHDTFNLAMSEQFEKLSIIEETLFYGSFSLRSRGTDLFVKRIELMYDFFAKTTVIDNDTNVFIYFLGVGLDESEESFVNRHYSPNQSK